MIAVWNTAARLRPNDHNPTWVRDLACDIPDVNWKRKNISYDPVLNARHPRTETGFFRSLKNFLLITVHTYSQPQSRTTLPNRIQSTLSQNIAWLEEWAYTDGSCQIHQGEQVTNAGTYRPALLNGLGITKKHHQQSWTGCYHSRHLPLTASRLSTKSGKTCCTLSFTATTYKGMFWR